MPAQGRRMAQEEVLGKTPVNRDVCLGGGGVIKVPMGGNLPDLKSQKT